MKCVFMLASAFGLQCFEEVRNIKEVETAGVVTPKEKYELKYGGGCSKEMENPVYHDLCTLCEKTESPLFIMEKMNSKETVHRIAQWQPDLIIVSGWYHMIGEEILQIPSKGVIGLHSSLLPKYRGGAPLVWQMINGEEFAGISLFYINSVTEGVDSGDIIGQRKVKIEENDTIGTLYQKVGENGIGLLKENIPLIARGCAPRKKQTELSDQDIFPQRSPADGEINWAKTSRQIYDFVRAQTKPYPGAFAYQNAKKVMIWSCEVIPWEHTAVEPGTVLCVERDEKHCYPVISTNDLEYAVKIKEYTVCGTEKCDGK